MAHEIDPRKNSNELSTISRMSLSPADDTYLDMLMMRTALYYPNQELSKLTIAEFRLAYGMLAVRHGIDAVEAALCEIKLRSKFFPHPAEITEAIEAQRAEAARQYEKGRWDRQEAHMKAKAGQEAEDAANCEYVDMGEIVKDYYRRRGQVPMEELAPMESAGSAIDRVMAAFSRGLAAGAAYEPHLIEEIRVWEKAKAQRQ